MFRAAWFLKYEDFTPIMSPEMKRKYYKNLTVLLFI